MTKNQSFLHETKLFFQEKTHQGAHPIKIKCQMRLVSTFVLSILQNKYSANLIFSGDGAILHAYFD